MARGVRLMAAVAPALVFFLLSGSVSGAQTETSLGVYTGPHQITGVRQFETWLGRDVSYVLDFAAADTWATISNPAALRLWRPTKANPRRYRLVVGVPIVPHSGGSLAEGATGAYNQYFRQLAQNLVRFRRQDSILRLGWEFGGDWEPWAVKTQTDAANSAAYWRQIVTTMRAVAPNLKFDWNPVWGPQPVNPELAYPGDAYVDYVGVDVYDQSWIGNFTDAAARWNDFMTAQWGATWHRDFASAHGKPMSFPEWGLVTRSDGHGGGDAPYFIQKMCDWISQNNVGYQIYFEYDASDGRHRLMTGQFPGGSEAFRERFGSFVASAGSG